MEPMISSGDVESSPAQKTGHLYHGTGEQTYELVDSSKCLRIDLQTLIQQKLDEVQDQTTSDKPGQLLKREKVRTLRGLLNDYRRIRRLPSKNVIRCLIYYHSLQSLTSSSDITDPTLGKWSPGSGKRALTSVRKADDDSLSSRDQESFSESLTQLSGQLMDQHFKGPQLW